MAQNGSSALCCVGLSRITTTVGDGRLLPISAAPQHTKV